MIKTGGNCTVGNSGPTSQSAADAAASATAHTRVTLASKNTNRNIARGGAGGTGGAGGVATGGSMSINNSATRVERHAAPAYAPSVSSFNPCAGSGASLGVQTPVRGVTGGAQSYDNACRLHQLGLDTAAVEYLRESNDTVRSAIYLGGLRRANLPCLRDLDKLNKAFAAAHQPSAALVVVGP